MHERPIDFKNGLVDPGALLEFMDGCHCDDLVSRQGRNHAAEGHHLYFPKPNFKKHPILAVRQLRNSKYNIVEMLSCHEDMYHQTVELEVPQDSIDLDAVNTFLEEGDALTDYAATSWLIADTQHALERVKILRGARANLAARLVILQEMQEAQEEAVKSISVMDDMIVTGALTKYYIQQSEKRLGQFIESRRVEGGQTLAPATYDCYGLQGEAEKSLDRKIRLQTWTLQKILSKPLVEAT